MHTFRLWVNAQRELLPFENIQQTKPTGKNAPQNLDYINAQSKQTSEYLNSECILFFIEKLMNFVQQQLEEWIKESTSNSAQQQNLNLENSLAG